ncbi:MAG: hypothetical protein LUQ59_08210 [Methanothrix sp.]|nr:hypothetical protein [Methanothrix sp.]
MAANPFHPFGEIVRTGTVHSWADHRTIMGRPIHQSNQVEPGRAWLTQAELEILQRAREPSLE